MLKKGIRFLLSALVIAETKKEVCRAHKRKKGKNQAPVSRPATGRLRPQQKSGDYTRRSNRHVDRGGTADALPPCDDHGSRRDNFGRPRNARLLRRQPLRHLPFDIVIDRKRQPTRRSAVVTRCAPPPSRHFFTAEVKI